LLIDSTSPDHGRDLSAPAGIVIRHAKRHGCGCMMDLGQSAGVIVEQRTFVAEGVEVVKKTDLIMPVYLNQRVVFDFVAMLEGGSKAPRLTCVNRKRRVVREASVCRHGADTPTSTLRRRSVTQKQGAGGLSRQARAHTRGECSTVHTTTRIAVVESSAG
jgi:hypothetical protein